MAASMHADDIPHFINTQIKPHLNKILRVLGNERPAAPIDFIADCFIKQRVPERSAPRAWDESLMSYLLNHDVVARVERAIATCAIRHATVENPLEFVGKLLREAPAPEEAVEPSARQTRPRPAALDVPGGGAGTAGHLSPCDDGPPPRSPGSALTTPVPNTTVGTLSLESPAYRGQTATRSTSYDTISRGSHHRLYQVVRPAVVRAGVEPTSLRTERLRIGERLTILESREFGGVTRVRFARGWTSMWSKENIPILVPVDEEDYQAVSEYRLRSPTMLMADLDPWSEPQAESAVGIVPLVQIRVSDGGETFVQTSSGWHCVSGWENMKALVPHWKPLSPSPLSAAASSGAGGEGGDPAFGSSGESYDGSPESTPKKMSKTTPRKSGRNGRGRQNSLLVRAGQSESFDALRETKDVMLPSGLFGANSKYRRNMSFFSQQQAGESSGVSSSRGTLGTATQSEGATSQHEQMQLALLDVDGG